MDMSQYLGVFIDEAREHLQNLNDKLMELEDRAEDSELMNSIFRSAHTLKGSSGQMGFGNMMELTHKMENVFDALRHRQIQVSSAIIDTVFETLDLLEAMIDRIEQGEDDSVDVSETAAKLQRIAGGSDGGGKKSSKPAVSRREQDQAGASLSHLEKTAARVRLTDYEQAVIGQALEQKLNVFDVSVTLRQDCMMKAVRALMVSNALEELGTIIKSIPSTQEIEQEAFDRQIIFVIATEKGASDVRSSVLHVSELEDVEVQAAASELDERKKGDKETAREKQAGSFSKGGERGDQVQKPKKPKRRVAAAKTIRVSLDRLDRLMNLFEEMIIDRSRLERIASSSDDFALKEAVDAMSRISGQLQETVLNLRMETVEQVFNRFPRMVRQLSKELGKKVNLVISGAETELDRTVLDEIGDPLMHMIRNSMDHGIEQPDVRRKLGKNPTGTLNMRAYHSGNHVFIEIEDDGAGINREKVLAKAVDKGIVSAEGAGGLSDKEVYHLLFASGFSTADKISDISGRGVGLDVVESKINALSGTVTVDSSPGQGTKFTIKLPLTLSIITAMLIQSGDEVYAIPITSIEETALRRQVQVRSVHRQNVITYRDKVVPLVDLRDFLKIPGKTSEPVHSEDAGSGSIVIARHGNQCFGIEAEQLIGYQDIVIKPLGNYLKRVKGFSGATILGDGRVVLILDCQSMIKV
ncbi:chemotaxis protein CheA [Sporolactobacillus sp. THM7-7]|nr:chemotaxis protein CheA [Sporolactobacillus sp. THM7-7]